VHVPDGRLIGRMSRTRAVSACACNNLELPELTDTPEYAPPKFLGCKPALAGSPKINRRRGRPVREKTAVGQTPAAPALFTWARRTG